MVLYLWIPGILDEDDKEDDMKPWTLDEKLVCIGTIATITGGTIIVYNPIVGAILMVAGLIAATLGLVLIAR